MAAFPKYHELICDTYTPNFTAGPAPCVLPSIQTATKSRLQAGGTFFRSHTDAGTDEVNTIKLRCVVTPISIISGVRTESVVLTITPPTGSAYSLPAITQVINESVSPDVCVGLSGFAQLRTALTSDNYVDMPVDDSGGSGWVVADEAYCMITAFIETPMAGALPASGAAPTGRTGPAYTLLHVGDIEDQANGSVSIAVNRLSEWDGTQWIGHPSQLFEPAYDADGNVIAPHPACPNPPPI